MSTVARLLLLTAMVLFATPATLLHTHTSLARAVSEAEQGAATGLPATQDAGAYLEEEVTFPNGDITLAGTLTLPETPGPHPALVLVSGSGPQDRDEDIGAPLKPFLVLADELTRAGVAVLRYDERGVGESTGTFSGATTADFATDAEAAIAYLLGRDEINPDQIGLLGHSEGGLVAAMLGARSDDLDFIITLAAPGLTGAELTLLQNRVLMELEGAPPEEIEAHLAYLEALMAVLDDPEAIATLTRDRVLAQIAAMPESERASIGDPDAYAEMIAERVVATYATGWFAALAAYDPTLDWAQTTVPVLAIFGGLDMQVPAEQNAPPIETALAEAGNDDVTVVILPGANHLFQTADTGSPAEYATLPAEFTPDLIPTLTDWLREHVTIVE